MHRRFNHNIPLLRHVYFRQFLSYPFGKSIFTKQEKRNIGT